MKKLIMLLCLVALAPSAMAGHDNGNQKILPDNGPLSNPNCAVWATGADGKAYCQSSGSTSNTQPHHNNQGCGGFNQQQCGWPNGQPMSPWQYQQVKATGRDAVNILMNSDMMASGVLADGWTRYTVRYTGDQYTSLQGVVFNCKVSPNGRTFECVNWLPPKPKQVQLNNGWEVIFELLNQYQQKKNQ